MRRLMSLLDTFRSWPTGPFKPDTWRRWMSGSRSPRPSGSTSRRRPELVPALAAFLLLVAAGAQLAMPWSADLPVTPRAKGAAGGGPGPRRRMPGRADLPVTPRAKVAAAAADSDDAGDSGRPAPAVYRAVM